MTLRYLKIVIVALAALAVVPGPAAAEVAEEVTLLDQTALLDQSGTLAVSEEIHYEFAGTAPHPVTRVIQLTYQDDQGNAYRVTLTPESVSADGVTLAQQPVITTGNATYTLPAGTSPVTSRIYVLKYKLAPIMTHGEQADVFKIPVTGTGWTVPINRAVWHFTSPLVAENVTCYAGPSGTTSGSCSVEQQGKSATITAYAPLAPGEALSALGNYPRGSFQHYLESTHEQPVAPAAQSGGWPGWATAGIIGLLVVAGLIAILVRRRHTKADEAPKV